MKFTNSARNAAFGLIVAAGLVVPASADVDFKDQTIEWIIPFSETGGSAKWANFFAPLLSEALPGQPTVVGRVRGWRAHLR